VQTTVSIGVPFFAISAGQEWNKKMSSSNNKGNRWPFNGTPAVGTAAIHGPLCVAMLTRLLLTATIKI
jgi:hypothetical protein